MHYIFGAYHLDTQRYELHHAGVLVPLRPKVFQVLAYLVAQHDRVVRKEELLEALWPGQFVGDVGLNTYIMEVRKALGDRRPPHQYIHTVRGQGYRLVAPVEVSDHAPPSPPRLSAPAARTDLPDEPPTQDTTPTAFPGIPDAERRQVTLLFCDLVDSTALAGQLDPEDYRAVLQAYLETCATVMARYGGNVTKFLGDGALVCFGYPQAHDDDPQRAVRAGLGIVEALAQVNTRLTVTWGVQLAVRIGIHTGLVVAGDLAVGATLAPQALVGEAPNIAARLQDLAAPNTVVCSAATARLVEGYFTLEALGAPRLKGVAAPLPVYRVVDASGAQTRFDVATARGLTPLVGREVEVALLHDRWAQVTEGLGQVVCISGEAGIGKSRLIQVLKDHVASEPHVLWESRGSPYYQHTAFYPLIDLWERALHVQREATAEAKLAQLERALAPSRLPLADTVPLVAALLALPVPAERYQPLALTPQLQKQRTLDVLLALVLERAAQHPVLVILEDLHWVDPSTLEFLTLLLDQGPTAAVLTVLTYRPEFQPPWGVRSHLTPLALHRLPPAQARALVAGVTGGKTLPPDVTHEVVAKTDGVPLFVEELTKMVLESELLEEQDDCYALLGPLPPLAIPTTLHDSLMARLDRLATVKSLAQLGATLGREFAYPLLHAVAPWDEATVQRGLHQLVEAELLYQRGRPPEATYLFKHVLIQDAAYQSLLRSTRQQYHQRIAQVLETRFPEIVETQPELVAHHYTEAGLSVPAIPYWQQAGQRAIARSANLEAISHLRTGIALLTTLPATPEHTQQALTLYIALGAALRTAKGHAAPEVAQAFTQARALCQQVGEPSQLAPVLLGLWGFYQSQSQFHTAHEIGDTLLHLARRTDDPALAVIAHYTLGCSWFWPGALAMARRHLEEGIARYTPAQSSALVFRMGSDPGVGCRFYAAQTLWLLGYPAQALAHLHEALTLAHALAHPLSLAWMRCRAAIFFQFCRDVAAVHEHAEAAVALTTKQGATQWVVQGTVFRGWALAMQGQGEVGLAQVHQAITAVRAAGQTLFVPYLYIVLADVCAHLGHPAAGLQALAEAHTLVEQHEERCWEAEVCRLRGVLLLRQTVPQPEEAKTWLQHALDVARRQEAKSLELRATMSLSRLWQQEGKRDEAREFLAPMYGWFTEGFDTADLREAKALLEELGG